MKIEREIELDAGPDEVWAALTEAEQLEQWFANDVEIDPTPGGRAVFQWDDGDVRRATVEQVDEGERILLRFDDDGTVDLRVVPVEQGTRVVVRETAPTFAAALELRALAACATR